MGWSVETLGAAVDKELEALPADLRARFSRSGRSHPSTKTLEKVCEGDRQSASDQFRTDLKNV